MRPTAPMFPRSTHRSSILSRPSGRRSEPLIQNATVVLGRVSGGRVDHLAHFGDPGRRKAADLGVLADDVLVFRQVDAERVVGGDIALDPLDVGAEIAQHAVRFGRRSPELLALQTACAGNVALDNEFAQSHDGLPQRHCRIVEAHRVSGETGRASSIAALQRAGGCHISAVSYKIALGARSLRTAAVSTLTRLLAADLLQIQLAISYSQPGIGKAWSTRRSGAPGSGSASPGSAAAGSAVSGSAPARARPTRSA